MSRRPRTLAGGHGYTLEAHVADSGRLGERSALRLVATLAAEAEALFRAGGLRDGLAAADVETDGEPETARIRETLDPLDARRRAALPPEPGGEATERGVVFSLGLVAFHALSGETPDGDGPPPVHALRARRVSEPTVELIRRAAAHDPGSRPRSLRDLRRAAEKILASTRWDGDRPCVARRAPHAPIALPALALAAAIATAALFHFRVGPFRAERVAAGLARIFSSADPEPEAAAAEDLDVRAIESLANARSRVRVAESVSGAPRFEAVREAAASLDEARSLLERHAASHPEARAEVERRLEEIEREMASCRRLAPPASD